MIWHILDESFLPVPCESVDKLCKWQDSLPGDVVRAGMGFQVADSDVGGRRVSTVFMGIDHSFGEGPPLLWETMTFPDGDICERYSSHQDALEGHERICREISAQ